MQRRESGDRIRERSRAERAEVKDRRYGRTGTQYNRMSCVMQRVSNGLSCPSLIIQRTLARCRVGHGGEVEVGS